MQVKKPDDKTFVITAAMLRSFDSLYDAADNAGSSGERHRLWGDLVDELRMIRRKIQAGVKVRVEGTDTVFTEWGAYYVWCHASFHKLEDGCDKWIGDDR